MRQLVLVIILFISYLGFSQNQLSKEELIGVWEIKDVRYRDIICRFGRTTKPKTYKELIGSTIEFTKNQQLYFYPVKIKELTNKEEIHLKWEFDDIDLISMFNFKNEEVFNIFIKYTDENVFFYNGGYKLMMKKI